MFDIGEFWHDFSFDKTEIDLAKVDRFITKENFWRAVEKVTAEAEKRTVLRALKVCEHTVKAEAREALDADSQARAIYHLATSTGARKCMRNIERVLQGE